VVLSLLAAESLHEHALDSRYVGASMRSFIEGRRWEQSVAIKDSFLVGPG